MQRPATPMRPGQRARLPYTPPARRSKQELSRELVDDSASIAEIQRNGRRIRELLRINASTPGAAKQPSRTSTPLRGKQPPSDAEGIYCAEAAKQSLRTSTPLRGKQRTSEGIYAEEAKQPLCASTPLRGKQPPSEALLQTPDQMLRGKQSPSEASLQTPDACRAADVDKWSSQVSSRSWDASTATPSSQTSARSLRCTPGPSPQSSARSWRSPTSLAGTTPVKGRPPKPPASSPKVQQEAGSPDSTKLRGKAANQSRPRTISPVPTSVLMLPERMAEAAQQGDVELMRQCISELPAGAPVCERDLYGWSSLHYAASSGHFEVCRLLLEARGDANAELPDFSTPIMLAVEEGNIPVAELLLQHGARTRSKDEAGFTVMERCAPGSLQEFTSCVQQYQ